MPDPVTPSTVPQGPPAGSQPVSLANAPGADLDWDSLFANPELTPQPAPQAPPAEPTPSPAAQPQPTVPAPQEFFLDAGTSKYKTREEAVAGFAEKDKRLQELRQYAIDKTGFDPLTGKEVPKEPPASQGPKNFLTDDKAYGDALSKAAEIYAKTGDWKPYKEVQRKLAQEAAWELIAPYVPVVQDAAKVKAVHAAATELKDPGLEAFLASDDYKKTLERFPSLKYSIGVAESDPNAMQNLAEFYRMAYGLSSGTKQAVTPVVPPAPAAQPAAPAVRPTTPVSTLTPIPAPGAAAQKLTTDELMRSPEGRKRLMEELRAKGVENFTF